jgi:hypothetical protein
MGFMRTQLFSPGMTMGGLLASAAFATSLASVSQAATTIQGTPTTVVDAGRYYGFQSWATDTDGRAVSYSIKNKPAWATFDTRYGHLYGVPTAASVGTYSNIVISASDGLSMASLPAFSITVAALGGTGTGGSGTTTTGSATLNWHPPTQNTNGTSITNLAGYTINYGTSATKLTSNVKLTNPGLTSYVIENLAAGTYYFGIAAYNSAGGTSSISNVVSKTIK